ncbi:MAG TPA: hypothetical protein VL728_19810 [Cyclobacteriaceae bacterium]|nr:hypothetical protein [Cyclobacteriaceae bacterium]
MPLVFGLGLTLFVLFAWLEVKKKQKLIGYRIAALFCLMISVIGLVLQPRVLGKEHQQVLLLTPGYAKSQADSVLKLNPDLKILRTQSADLFPASEELASGHLNAVDVKYILGAGLPKYALDELRPSNYVFIPPQRTNGVIALNLPEVFSGRPNIVSGVFNASQTTKLKLVGPAGVEDSTVVDQATKSFAFSFTPKLPGLFIYHLISEDKAGSKKSERLPIDVKSPAKLHILFLQDFPTVEFRNLKNFLADDGHSVVIQTRTSKSNFTEEFINAPKVSINNLSSRLLTSFDLLLADSKTINRLTSSEKSDLEHAVQNGLGLVLIGDLPAKKNEFYSIEGRSTSTDTAHFQINNKGYVLPAQPTEVTPIDGLTSILKNKKRTLTGYRFLGAGKIGFQLLQETYRIKLEGNGADYAAIWSTLLEKVSRKKAKNFDLKMNTFFPYYADEPVTFSVVSAGGIADAFSDDIKIPLIENVIINDYWHGKTWPKSTGWHQLRVGDSTLVNYFVHDVSEWTALSTVRMSNETRIAQFKTLQNHSPLPTSNPVSPFIFYLIFLFSAAFLWLAPKI